MSGLKYKLTNDVLFKMLFVRRQGLLKRLVAELLSLRLDSIADFVITNPEMPPDIIGGKFCRLDINMTVDGTRVDLEIQVADEGDFPERSLYYWAREYSAAIDESMKYSRLPRTIVVSILAFTLFDCAEFHSEFQLLEIARHTLLTDRLALHYFELPKLPEGVKATDELGLWLALFNAKTEEDLARLEALEVPVMTEAITTFREVSVAPEFKELERARHYAKHNEASALGHAHDLGRAEGRQEGRAEGIAEGMEKGVEKGKQEGRLEVARVALAEGMSAETVAKFTGLSVAEITALRTS